MDDGLKDLIEELDDYGRARKGELAGMVLEAANRLREMRKEIIALEQEPCEDAISRQAAIDAVAFGITYATGVNMETGEVSYPFAESNQELRKAIHRICELPLVTPKQRTGHWIKTQAKQGGISEIWYSCSECGWRNALYLPRSFCPNCGADMREEQACQQQ